MKPRFYNQNEKLYLYVIICVKVLLIGCLSIVMVANDDVYSLINYTNFVYFVFIVLALGTELQVTV